MQCGARVWNQMKIWSSHLLDNLSNCLMNLKKSGDSTGFEPMTSTMSVQCSNQLSYEVTQCKTGQFVGLMFSRERNVAEVMGSSPVESPVFFRFMRQLLKLSSECEDHIFIWFCVTVVVNASTAVGALLTLIDFTLSNARRFLPHGSESFKRYNICVLNPFFFP